MKKVDVKVFAAFFVIIGNAVASNFPPMIRMQTGSLIQAVHENITIGTKLFGITARDRNGGTVTVHAAGETSELVTVNRSGTTWEVFLKKKLHRATQAIYHLLFIAISSVQDAPTSALEVTLIVNDVNDEPPRFSQPLYHVQVPENHSLSDVFDVSNYVIDLGADITGWISFYIKPAGQAVALYGETFTIGEFNGLLLLKKPLDYERLAYYQYKLIAKDGGTPSLTGTADLLITVLDVQDTPPVFQRLPYMTSIKENCSVGRSIFKVLAVDGDTITPNNITYSLTSDFSEKVNCSEFFTVDPDTGIIKIIQAMDSGDRIIKELHGICTVGVKASEVTREPKNVTETVVPFIITIEDVNDNLSIPQGQLNFTTPCICTNSSSAMSKQPVHDGNSSSELKHNRNGIFEATDDNAEYKMPAAYIAGLSLSVLINVLFAVAFLILYRRFCKRDQDKISSQYITSSGSLPQLQDNNDDNHIYHELSIANDNSYQNMKN